MKTEQRASAVQRSGHAPRIFGKVPVKFEKATYRGMDFVVQDMDGHKIKSVKIVTKGQVIPNSHEA